MRTHILAKGEPDPKALVGLFEANLAALNRSPNTISLYARSVERFLAHLVKAGVCSPADTSRQDIETYQAKLIGQSYTIASVAAFMTAIRAFFRFLSANDAICICVSQYFPRLPQYHRLPRQVLTRQEVAALLKAPDTTTRKGILYRAILETAYSAGLRRAEICSLSVQDVDTAHRQIAVRRGKGCKDRVVPIGAVASSWVQSYLDLVRPALVRKGDAPQQDILFLGERYGRPIDHGVVSDMLKRYAAQAGIKRTVSLHGLRHAFATHMLQTGARLSVVKDILGHERISTTQQYISLTIADLKKSHHRYHPREQ